MSCTVLMHRDDAEWRAVHVCPPYFNFGRMESLHNFINAGGKRVDWPNNFIIVDLTDCDEQEAYYVLSNSSDDICYFKSDFLDNVTTDTSNRCTLTASVLSSFKVV